MPRQVRAEADETGKGPMSTREQLDQLMEKIDAVLDECGKGPRQREPARSSARPAWPGPRWAQHQRTADAAILARQTGPRPA